MSDGNRPDLSRDPEELGALWEKDGPKGKYFSGNVNGVKIVVFKNSRKASDKAPDWRILKAKPKPAAPRADFDDGF